MITRTTDQPWELMLPLKFDKEFSILKHHDDGLSRLATIPERYPHLAALFMAAPDLLAACKTMLTDVQQFVERGGKLTDREADHVEQMKMAVEKAETEPPKHECR